MNNARNRKTIEWGEARNLFKVLQYLIHNSFLSDQILVLPVCVLCTHYTYTIALPLKSNIKTEFIKGSFQLKSKYSQIKRKKPALKEISGSPNSEMLKVT